MAGARAPQLAALEVDGVRYEIDLRQACDLSIAVDFDQHQPSFFGAPKARRTPLVIGSFSGQVQSGASCNCSTITLTPHCDSTHTECVGHLTVESLAARNVIPGGFLKALLVSVTPEPAGQCSESTRPAPQPGDLLVSEAALKRAWPARLPFAPEALIVRTLPNSPLKRTRDYGVEPAAFLSLPAAAFMVQRGVEHLVLDLPSADRADDGGQLSAHREFFGLPSGERSLTAARRPQCTITELAYIEDALADGAYFLSLQFAALGGDAIPSRPLLYPVRQA